MNDVRACVRVCILRARVREKGEKTTNVNAAPLSACLSVRLFAYMSAQGNSCHVYVLLLPFGTGQRTAPHRAVPRASLPPPPYISIAHNPLIVLPDLAAESV